MWYDDEFFTLGIPENLSNALGQNEQLYAGICGRILYPYFVCSTSYGRVFTFLYGSPGIGDMGWIPASKPYDEKGNVVERGDVDE